jgi:hypothetical protein
MAFGEHADREMLDRYRILRNAGKTLSTKLTQSLPKSVIVSAARDLGLWKRGALVAEQHELDVLMDRAIYDEKRNDEGALDRFLESSLADDLTKDEHRYCAIMRSARFSLFQVVRVVPGSDVTLIDRLFESPETEDTPVFRVIDFEMSKSLVPGLPLATRLLDAGDFSMTSGVSFPFRPEQEPEILAYLIRKEFGSRRRRIDQPERYSVFFHDLHQRIGIPVRYSDEAGAETSL